MMAFKPARLDETRREDGTVYVAETCTELYICKALRMILNRSILPMSCQYKSAFWRWSELTGGPQNHLVVLHNAHKSLA